MPKTYTSEKDVKKAVKKILEAHNWFWWMPPANMYGKAGISDFNCLKQGVFMAVETKFGKNQPTAPQVAFLNSIRACDSFAFLVNENNVEHFDAMLSAFDRATSAQMKKQEVQPEDGAMMLNAIAALTDY